MRRFDRFQLLTVATLVLFPASATAELADLRARMAGLREGLTSVVMAADQRMEVTRDGQALGPPMESSFRLSFRDPDRLRLESEGSRTGASVTVFDGTTTTIHVQELGQYVQFAGAPNLNQSTAGPTGPQSMRDAILDRIAPVLPEDAARVGEESLTVDGDVIPCTVVRHGLPGAGPEAEGSVTLWIDPRRGVVLRGDVEAPREIAPGNRAQTTSSLIVRSIELEPELGEEPFTFTAPEGAQRVERFSAGSPRSFWKGKEAPDFVLEDLDGTPVRLSELRGKVVLLDFWATWCGPCKIELPHVEKLRKEFEDQGLVVLGISSETPGKVRKYLEKEGYGFPSLVDQGGRISMAYRATTIPTTLVVGRDGVVVEHWTGAQPESTLRRGLAAAGLE